MDRRSAGPRAARHSALVAGALATTLAGCAVGPDYQRPGSALPGDFAAVATTPPGDATVIPNDWWKLFNDPQLDALVDAALANNPNIRLVVARVDEARAALRETNAAFFPEVDYSGLGTRARSGVNGGLSGGSASSATGGGTLAATAGALPVGPRPAAPRPAAG